MLANPVVTPFLHTVAFMFEAKTLLCVYESINNLLSLWFKKKSTMKELSFAFLMLFRIIS